jgi:hypothetical protein
VDRARQSKAVNNQDSFELGQWRIRGGHKPWHTGVAQAHRSRAGTRESAQAHRSRRRHTKSSYAKDFAFVAHRIKGSYDQKAKAVGHEGRQSRILGFESTHTKVNGVGTRTGVSTHTPQMPKILHFGGLNPKYFAFRQPRSNLLHSTVSNAKYFAFRQPSIKIFCILSKILGS